ncbi:BRF1-domain-containing protein [Lojkania enalia]|uniref:BRF1-domain-containing protein n=1 Tax=Lojkania enalia TaxID=147567 RepID=A0A9P4MYJ1_9PLEO|nr:BRF1-domain-containing protein [Didymosphaeria enalia]
MPGPIAAARPRVERLGSLKSPQPPLSTTSSARSSPTPPAAPPKPKEPIKRCCDDPNISEEDGSMMCYNCGQVLQESEIVADVTFGETASGAAMVQGGFVGDGQRHANTMGGTTRGLGGATSREQTEFRGRDEIRKLCASLNLSQMIEEQAMSFYKLLIPHSFTIGRRVRTVAAITIYLACRRRPQNTLLLMDLAEKIHVDVWTLGGTYRAALKALMIDDPAIYDSQTVQEIEPLMLKFCLKLEFHEASHRVAEDAVRILKRMRRDWMVQGRQPAGLCGACIILAARMNNFRRTVREVVYVVRVADSTINQRLYEFKRIPASNLTVQQFRDIGHLLKVKDTTEPPAIYKRREKEERKRKRSERATTEVTPGAKASTPTEVVQGEELPTGSSEAPQKQKQKQQPARKKRKVANGKAVPSSEATPSETPPASEPRRDAEGFIIPDLPNESTLSDAEYIEDTEDAADSDYNAAIGADETLPLPIGADDAVPVPKRRGRPPKKNEPIVIPEEDLEIEAEIEAELQSTIDDYTRTQEFFEEMASNENHSRWLQVDGIVRNLLQKHMPDNGVSTAPDIDEEEFADDEEVMNCRLSPEEIAIKERLWVTQNEEWLREKQARDLEKKLEEASGKAKKPKQRRKHHQMGDGSVLEGRPAASPREAVEKMLKKRAKHFSSHINYDALNELFPDAKNKGRSEGNAPEEEVVDEGNAPPTTPAVQAGTAEVVEEIEEGDEDYYQEEEGGYDQGGYNEDGEFEDPRQYMDDDYYNDEQNYDF